MDMKKLLESIQNIEECPSEMGEAPMAAMPAPAPMDQGDPVRMNVNISAAGKEHVADLLDMMKHAGLGDAAPAPAKTLAPRLDMERLRGIVDGPEMAADEAYADAAEDELEEYENEPEEKYGDIADIIPDGDDLHRTKARKAIRTNDPALESIKDKLYAALSEKKAKPDFLDMDGDGDKKEPMKKALKDKKAKKD